MQVPTLTELHPVTPVNPWVVGRALGTGRLSFSHDPLVMLLSPR